MPGLDAWKLARAAAGLAAGLALWWVLTPSYGRLLATAAEPLVRFLERPPATRLYAENRLVIVERSDFGSDSDRPALPADDLTFNVALLLALAATVPGLLRDRGVLRLALSLVTLFVTHVLGLWVTIESLYATQLGPWSAAHYGALSRNLWATAAHFYRLVGLYAVAFLLWWLLLRGAGDAPEEAPRRRAKKRA